MFSLGLRHEKCAPLLQGFKRVAKISVPINDNDCKLRTLLNKMGRQTLKWYYAQTLTT